MRLALEHDEFELHYQPQLDMQARFIGAEALLRWRHPEHGLIDPAEFVLVSHPLPAAAFRRWLAEHTG